MGMIALSDGPFGTFRVLDDEDNDILVQNDTDYPGLASTFGWSVRDVETPTGCEHTFTDGSIDCPECGTTSDHFICKAVDFLADNVGKVVEDPGYFSED